MKVLKLIGLFLMVAFGMLSFFQIVYAGIAPDFTLTDIDGNTFSLSHFRGRVVLLDFFATWCGPCRAEMPHLRAVKEEFHEIVVISISVDPDYDSVERLNQFRQDYNITWILARDTANVYSRYNVTAIPTLYIIDQEGLIKFHHVGLTEEEILIIEVGQLLPIRSFIVTVEDLNFQVSIESNSVVTAFSFNKVLMQIQFNVSGTFGTYGYCNVTVPKSLMKGEPWSINIDGTQTTELQINENNTHTFIYFTYTHTSTKRVTIQGTWVVPEHPFALTALLLFIITILTTLKLNKAIKEVKVHVSPGRTASPLT